MVGHGAPSLDSTQQEAGKQSVAQRQPHASTPFPSFINLSGDCRGNLGRDPSELETPAAESTRTGTPGRADSPASRCFMRRVMFSTGSRGCLGQGKGRWAGSRPFQGTTASPFCTPLRGNPRTYTSKSPAPKITLPVEERSCLARGEGRLRQLPWHRTNLAALCPSARHSE